MFAPPSLQREYTLCSSLDPALDLPDVPSIDRETAQPEEIERVDKLIEEYKNKLKVARHTGRWNEITKPGEKPTCFRFRLVHGARLTWFKGECGRRDLGEEERLTLLFRLALVGIDNFKGFEYALEETGSPRLVNEECLERLYDIGRGEDNKPSLGRLVMLEISSLVAERTMQGVPPLS